MRKFYFLILFLISVGSLVLGLLFRYSLTTVFYHILIMVASLLVLQLTMIILSIAVKPKKPFMFLLHLFCASYFFLIAFVYIFIFFSNFFWKKTITFPIIRNYFSKFDNFISALPIQGWIFYTTGGVLVLITLILYYLFRPNAGKVHQQYLHIHEKKNLTRFAVSITLALLLLFLLRTPLLKLKRNSQFAEEPVLQFFLGGLWGQGNEVAFDKQRYLLGKKDESCLDSLQIVPNPDDHAIVVILLDALRSDHLPMYGYSRNTTPFLDSLYRNQDLLVVQHAFSPSTSTVGGVAGLFYSRDWTEFGYNGLNIMKYLKKANYTTYAFLTGFHRDWFGLSALYRGSNDYYYESPKNPDIPPDDDLVTIKKILSTPVVKRSFIYIHLLSTHTIGKKDPSFRKFVPDKIGIGVDKKTALENNYDNGILQADAVIRQIFGKLKAENIIQNCTIFILADHGEMFGENGQWSHGGSVHPKLITIPFLIYDSNRNWYKNLKAATLKDVAPTIADRLGYPVPACWEGYSLHLPPQDFTMKINTVTETDYPFGVLSYNSKSFRLQIMDAKKELQKTLLLTKDDWTEAIQAK